MKPIKCRVCGEQAEYKFEAEIMNGKHKVKYFFCPNCELTQVEEPYWLDEAYASPMNLTDVGVIRRNTRYSKMISVMLLFMFGTDPKYLDYSGGYGIFTRLMRDLGFDFYWNDPYTQNLLARGFEYDEKMPIKALTSFEVFEHMVDVTGDLEKMIKVSGNIFFSTQVTPDPLPEPKDWWYFGLEHGQHTSLYRVKTFQYLGDKYDLETYSNGADLHIFVQDKFAPQFIEKRQLHLFLSKLNPTEQELLKKSYVNYAPTKAPLSGIKGLLQKNYHNYKYGEFYKLGDVGVEIQEQIHNILKENNLLPEYMHYLFANAENLHEFFFEESWDHIQKDMKEMKKFIHAD